MMQCPNCGETNQPSAVFCRSCGGRLLPPHLLEKKEQKILKKNQVINKKEKQPLVRFIVALLFLATPFYLIIQPLPLPRTPVINERYAIKLEEKLLKLRESYNNLQPYRVALTEDELNSFFKQNAFFTIPLSFNLFLDDGLVIYITHTILKKNITLKIYTGLLIKNHRIAPDILQVRLGKLPIPSFLTNYLINKFLIKKVSTEFEVPPYVTGFEFSENLMYVHYSPKDEKMYEDQYPSHKKADEILKQANDLYKQKKYRQAIRLYNTIIREYPDDPRIPDIKQWIIEINKRFNLTR